MSHVKAIVTLSNLLAGTLCTNVHIVTSVMLKRELESVRREHPAAREHGMTVTANEKLTCERAGHATFEL